MTFEADLIDRIKTVCPRAFLGFAPVSTARPYVTVQQIGGDVVNPLDNSDPGTRFADVQVDVWAGSYAEAVSTSRALEVALRASTDFTARPASAAATSYDADVPVYRAGQDFSCRF